MVEQVHSRSNMEEAFIKKMLDASIHAILLVEPVYKEDLLVDFIIKRANAALAVHAGLQPENITGKRLSEIFPTYKEYGFFNVYKDALETDLPQRRQLFYKDDRTDGWFDIGVTPHGQELVVSFANITDHINFQKELEQSANHLHTIINTAQSGIFSFAPIYNDEGEITDFRFTNANPSFAAYVGQQPQQLIGDPGSKWFPSYKENGLFEKYKETCITGKSTRFDFHYNDDGIDVWLDIMATRLGDEVLITFTDFTSVKKLQLQLEETITELKRSNTSLQDFAYIASHDLQEPLRKIHFFADRLKHHFQPLSNKEGEDLLNRIEAASSRMGKLIDDLLEYSLVSSTPSQKDKVSLQLVIKEVLTDLEASIQEKQAIIETGTLPEVNADPVMIRRMFQNLLGNALKYQKPGTTPRVTITTKKVTGREIRRQLKMADSHKSFYQIEVADNGVGFQQEHAEKIFHIFQRLHGKAEYPGTGVGLAIVQKVIENHHGYIWATSSVGNGACFVILLPIG